MNDVDEEVKGAHINAIPESVRSNVTNSILQEEISGRPTEINNDVRYTEVNNDYMFNPIEGFQSNSMENTQNESIEKKEGENEENKDNQNNKEATNDKKNKKQQKSGYNMNKQKLDFKVIVLGDIAVGKTSVIGRYITNTFSEVHKSSISCEFKKKKIEVDADTEVNLQIWDTVGEERFLSVTKQYYNNSHGAMIIYDLTNRNSFTKMNKWINDVKDNAPKNIVIMIVGNKSDLTDKKVDLGEELNPFKQNYMYLEVSAKNGTNVSLAFEDLTFKIIEKQKEISKEEPVMKDTIPLKKNPGKQKKKTCNC